MQAKLRVGRTDDPLERQADQVAERVLRADPVGPLSDAPHHPQRKCAACEAEDRQALRRQVEAEDEPEEELIRPEARAGGPVAAGADGAGAAVADGGRPLSPAERAYFEPRFSRDFADVRVHDEPRAHRAAEAINARAFTLGSHIAFGQGECRPATSSGRALFAHELAHVVQQGSRPAPRVQRAVREENVSCRNTGLRNPDVTGPEAVAAIRAADGEAITLARRAELLLDFHLLFTRAGDPIDAEFDTILQEELGLSLANARHHPLIEQQRDRFRRVRETLESGYLRYMCRGDKVKLVGCAEGTCGENFAFSCPGNRLVVLCQAFWNQPDEQAGTILHEPFHIWFHMARHVPNALRRADASCFESFALRVAGRDAPASCVDHTDG